MKRATLTIGMLVVLSVLNFVPIGSTVKASPRAVSSPAVALRDTYVATATRDMSTLKAAAFKQALATQKAKAALAAIHWIRGYSLQDGWFCYGWPAYYHCTLSYHKEAKPHTGYISDNPAWVPNNMDNLAGSSSAKTVNYTQSAPSTPSGSSAGWWYSFAPQEFCKSLDFGNENYISQWSVPPSCYGNIYYPNPADYQYEPSYGWCNWWPEVLTGYANLWALPYRSSYARPGAVVFYSGGVQGASSDGHFSYVVAVSPDRYWVLVTEMNFYWRGGGWQKVNYRYIHVGAGVTFLY